MSERLKRLKNELRELNDRCAEIVRTEITAKGKITVRKKTQNKYIPQIYNIAQADPPIKYNASEFEVRKYIERVKDVSGITAVFEKARDQADALDKLCLKYYTKIRKIQNLTVPDCGSDEISEKVIDNVRDALKPLIETVLYSCIDHYNRQDEPYKIQYTILIKHIQEYLKGINVYTFNCPEGANYMDEDISKYFSEKTTKTFTNDEKKYGEIVRVIYPPHIIKYYDRFGNEDLQIIEGKCEHYCEALL